MPEFTVIEGGRERVVDGPRDPLQLAFIERSDKGNARRMNLRFGHKLKYLANAGWIHFNGKHWTFQDAEGAAMRAALETTDLIRDEAEAWEAANGKGELAGLLKAWAMKSGQSSRLDGMLKISRSLMGVRFEDFDAEPLALNVENGTLRFKPLAGRDHTVTLYPHDAKDMLSRTASVAYDPEAKCPLWDAHLERMLPDEEVRAFIQRLFGYCLTGLTREQAFFIFQGRGGDGKSTTVNTVRRVLGEYATTADVKTFMSAKAQGGGDSASPALASLAGDVRLVSTSEPPKGSQLNDGVVKLVTGGAPLKVRHLNKGLFEYTPRWKIVLECNALPYIPGADEGIWRRAKLVLWTVQLTRDQMDSELESKLAKEAPGILNWLIEGALSYLEGGLMEPEAVKAALANFRAGANVFGEWLASGRVIIEPEATCAQKELYADFEAFCEENGHEPKSASWFGSELSNQQINRMARLHARSRNVMRLGARLATLEELASSHGEATPSQSACETVSHAPPIDDWLE